MLIKSLKEEILSYLEDSSNLRTGTCEGVFIPEDEKETLEAVNICLSKKEPFTVSGGGTGTVGGRIPFSGYVISTEKLNKIKNSENNKVCLQSGVVIHNFLNEIENAGKFYPPYPTEKSAFIGGNVSTNASGEYSFRFGATRRYVEKIRMVTGAGRLIEIQRGKHFADADGIIRYADMKIPVPSYKTPEIKCSAGYFSKTGMDLIDLIIGSEGTLGVITEVEVRLMEKLPERFILILFLKNEERVIEFLSDVQKKFANELYMLEFFDNFSLEFLKSDFPEIPGKTCAFYIESVYNDNILEKWMNLSETYNAVDVIAGSDKKNYERLINFRHRLPENINTYFKKLNITKISLDLAVSKENFSSLFSFYRSLTSKTNTRTVLFGHIGESHLHFNLFPVDENERNEVKEIYIKCLRKVLSMGGTVSAEHGIGKIKHRYLEMMYGQKGIGDMLRVKKIFDPQGLTGPDNLFDYSLVKSYQ
ncbi:MAG: FAD-binding oxidoreductase [Candidatus Omnitrophica bacterium]|nr:FAD-binding oxidoreductase [Candidatus Omnitrophota bacterium]